MNATPPLITLALMTWNHERMVADALRAALAQDYSPLEIVVSDDASSDGTWAIVERLTAQYHGPHRIRLNRNIVNLGVGAHCDQVIEMAQGEMVVLSAGDDIDAPHRVSAIARAWQVAPQDILCIASHAMGIDENGNEIGAVAPCTFGPQVDAFALAQSGEALLGATLAVHKRVLQAFGPMGADIRTCEDVVLPFRAALLGRIAILEQQLVRYRRHGASLQASGGPLARDAEHYHAGFLRMVRGLAAARRLQLADLATALRLGHIDRDSETRLAALLKRHLTRESLYVDLLQRQKGSLAMLARLARAGRVPPSAAIKMLLAAFAGNSWYRYQRWRYWRNLRTRRS